VKDTERRERGSLGVMLWALGEEGRRVRRSSGGRRGRYTPSRTPPKRRPARARALPDAGTPPVS